MGLFKKSSWGAAVMQAPQPNPYNFIVVSEKVNGDYLLAEVKYPDATNFEGNKILLIKGKKTLRGITSLDPHFLKHSGVLIMARFRPDVLGRALAAQTLEMWGGSYGSNR